MSAVKRTGYRPVRNMDRESTAKFFVYVSGPTNGAHQEFVRHLRVKGQVQVSSLEQSDFLLVFCPVASRVGTDIREALGQMPVGKPTVLVVMHHTFDPDLVVAPSRRQVGNPDVVLTVDCLFHETNLLRNCNRNDIALYEVLKHLGVPPETSTWADRIRDRLKENCLPLLGGFCAVVIVVVIIVVVVEEMQKQK